MKQWIKLGLIGMLSLVAIQAEDTKLYEVESGKVSYVIKGSGNIMGSETKSIGKKRLIFDNYGANNLTEENKVEKTSIMGQTQTQKSHSMTYIKKGVMYRVDFGSRKIVRMESAMTMLGGNMAAKGKEMMQQMGGKKTGMDKVLGYECEVWELMGTKQCIYKGVPIKFESNVMGMKHTEVAINAEFDIAISNDDFKLPDFPLTNEMGSPIDKNSLAKMDKHAKNGAEEQQEQLALLMGAMSKASNEAGVQPGQRSNANQEEQMKNSMMNSMLPMMKREVLSEEKNMRLAKACLEDADTLKEANVCNKKLNEMSGEEDEPFSSWNASEKKEIMQDINQYLNVILPCVKSAQSAQAMQLCMGN